MCTKNWRVPHYNRAKSLNLRSSNEKIDYQCTHCHRWTGTKGSSWSSGTSWLLLPPASMSGMSRFWCFKRNWKHMTVIKSKLANVCTPCRASWKAPVCWFRDEFGESWLPVVITESTTGRPKSVSIQLKHIILWAWTVEGILSIEGKNPFEQKAQSEGPRAFLSNPFRRRKVRNTQITFRRKTPHHQHAAGDSCKLLRKVMAFSLADAYDAKTVIGYSRQLEDALDQRTAELIALQKAAVEHAVVSPIKSLPLQSALGPWAAGHVRKPTIAASEAPDGQELIASLPQVGRFRINTLTISVPVWDLSHVAHYQGCCAEQKFSPSLNALTFWTFAEELLTCISFMSEDQNFC